MFLVDVAKVEEQGNADDKHESLKLSSQVVHLLSDHMPSVEPLLLQLRNPSSHASLRITLIHNTFALQTAVCYGLRGYRVAHMFMSALYRRLEISQIQVRMRPRNLAMATTDAPTHTQYICHINKGPQHN